MTRTEQPARILPAALDYPIAFHALKALETEEADRQQREAEYQERQWKDAVEWFRNDMRDQLGLELREEDVRSTELRDDFDGATKVRRPYAFLDGLFFTHEGTFSTGGPCVTVRPPCHAHPDRPAGQPWHLGRQNPWGDLGRAIRHFAATAEGGGLLECHACQRATYEAQQEADRQRYASPAEDAGREPTPYEKLVQAFAEAVAYELRERGVDA